MSWHEKNHQSQDVVYWLKRLCCQIIFLCYCCAHGWWGGDCITVGSCVSFCYYFLCSSFLCVLFSIALFFVLFSIALFFKCFCFFFLHLFFLPSSSSSLYSCFFHSFFLPFLFSFMSFFFFGSFGTLWKWCQVRYNSCSKGLVPFMIQHLVSRQVLDIVQYYHNITTIEYLAGSWSTPRQNVWVFIFDLKSSQARDALGNLDILRVLW